MPAAAASSADFDPFLDAAIFIISKCMRVLCLVILYLTDCRVLRERLGGGCHAAPMVAPEWRRSAACMADVWTILRADDVRLLLRGRSLGFVDAEQC